MRTVLIVALLLVASVADPRTAQAARLPATVVPSHYALWFAPDLARATFRGRTTIDVTVREASTRVVLHAAELRFQQVIVADAGGRQRARVVLDPAQETATLEVTRPLRTGTARLEFTYTGILNDKLRGLYLAEAGGRRYAVSQMEATDARRAFPCFDEPALKATFDVSATVPRELVAISNGRQLRDRPDPGGRTHTLTFSRTPRLSTYLVALFVGAFECRENTAEGIPVRVCATPGTRRLTGFALETAREQLRYFTAELQVPYPFDKLDLIAVPDFAAGAMENAGAIAFRESALLADPDTASVSTRLGVATTIAHELAHQWFGDLVTMRWWDDLWLNEGFATWMESRPVAALHPEWQAELGDVQSVQEAIATDVLRHTRPVRLAVETPDAINEAFDAIAYQKGAALLRSAEQLVGRERFRAGITAYLRQFAWGNVRSEDAWDALTRSTGQPVDRIMRGFIDQPGVPVVSMARRCEDGVSTVSLTQQRFDLQGPAIDAAATTWGIPVCARSAGGATRCALFEGVRASITVPSSRCGDPLVPNVSGWGYYLARMEPDDVRALVHAPEAMTAPERLRLAGDEWWLLRGGHHDLSLYLEVAAALVRDPAPAILREITSRLSWIGGALFPPDGRAVYQDWLRAQLDPLLAQLGSQRGATTESDLARTATLLSVLGGTARDPDVLRDAAARARRYLDDPSTLEPALVSTIVSLAATGGDASLYERYLGMVDRRDLTPAERDAFLAALTAFEAPALIARTQRLAISPAVRTQDGSWMLSQLLEHPASRDSTWQFVRANWPAIETRLGVYEGLATVVRGLGGFCSTDAAREIETFFQEHPTSAVSRSVDLVVERVTACAATRARQASAVEAWLRAHAGASGR